MEAAEPPSTLSPLSSYAGQNSVGGASWQNVHGCVWALWMQGCPAGCDGPSDDWAIPASDNGPTLSARFVGAVWPASPRKSASRGDADGSDAWTCGDERGMQGVSTLHHDFPALHGHRSDSSHPQDEVRPVETRQELR